MVIEWLSRLQEFWQSYPFYIQLLFWVVFLLGVLLFFYLLFSIILAPLMWLYNKLTDKNKSNVMTHEDFLIGELTEKIQGSSMGEVMEIGSKEARSVYPAKLYKAEDVTKDVLLPVGTKVIIVDFDENGIALVIKNKNFVE